MAAQVINNGLKWIWKELAMALRRNYASIFVDGFLTFQSKNVKLRAEFSES
jgi:hypothetical protein